MSGELTGRQDSPLVGANKRSNWSAWPRSWRWLFFLLACAALPVTVARLSEYEGNIFGLLISFLPWFLPVALVAFVCALLSRSYAAVAVALLCLICNTIWFVPYLGNADMAKPDNPNFVIMSTNTTKGRADIGTVETLAKENDVDLLLLQEVTSTMATQLQSSELRQQFPYHLGESGDLIYSKKPLEWIDILPSNLTGSLIGAKTTVAGQEITLVNVHPSAPLSIDHKGWNNDHPLMIELLASIKGPAVIAGDFNATPDHQMMRQFAAMGYSDVAIRAGNAREHTYPNGKTLPPVPMVTIDHVLYRDLNVTALDSSTHIVDGTDHRTLIAKLRID